MEQPTKFEVQSYWEAEPCGSRGFDPAQDSFFESTETRRQQLDGSLISGFAEFDRWRGRRVLEIGVGTGVDFLSWARAGALAEGIDLTERAVELTRRRLAREGFDLSVQQADAEQLPFPDGRFDLVYSWGVLHHTPSPAAALAEVRRVLAPGGEARIMLYHRRSWVALQAWLRYGLGRGRSAEEVLASQVESPGTKAYTLVEVQRLFGAFTEVRVTPRLTAYDTFEYAPRDLHGHLWLRLARRLYPRHFVSKLGDRFGWNLLISAQR